MEFTPAGKNREICQPAGTSSLNVRLSAQSRTEHLQERNLDRQRLLDVIAKMLTQFFQSPDSLQNVMNFKPVGQPAGLAHHVREIPCADTGLRPQHIRPPEK